MSPPSESAEAARIAPPRVESRSWGWSLALLAGLALLATFAGSGVYEPRGDELRYAAVVDNAVERGHWLDLRKATGELYRNKPPLIFWLAGLVSSLVGSSVVLLPLATRLMAVGTVLFTADLTRRWYGTTAGYLAGVAVLTSSHFLEVSREFRTDSSATFGLSMAMWALALPAAARVRPAVFMVGITVAVLGKWLVGLLPIGCALVALALPAGRSLRRGRFWIWLPLLVIPAAWEIQIETAHPHWAASGETCSSTLDEAPRPSAPNESLESRRADGGPPAAVAESTPRRSGGFADHFLRLGLLAWVPWSLFMIVGTARDLKTALSRGATDEERLRALLVLAWIALLLLGWASRSRSYERYFFLLLSPFAILAGREMARAGRALLGSARTRWLVPLGSAAVLAAIAVSWPTRLAGFTSLPAMREEIEKAFPQGDLPVFALRRVVVIDEWDLAYARLVAERCVRYVGPGEASPVLVRTSEWRDLTRIHPGLRRLAATRVMTIAAIGPPPTGDAPTSSR